MQKVEGINLQELAPDVEKSTADEQFEKDQALVREEIKKVIFRINGLKLEIRDGEKRLNGLKEKLEKAEAKMARIRQGDWSVLSEGEPKEKQSQEK